MNDQVNIPNASNISSRLDDSSGWTFFDLNMIHDECIDDSVTTAEANFYHANDMVPLPDEIIVRKVMSFLSKCIKDFEDVTVVDKGVGIPQYFTYFLPGSYKYVVHGSTSFPNLFMAGDWIINQHGSWLQF